MANDVPARIADGDVPAFLRRRMGQFGEHSVRQMAVVEVFKIFQFKGLALDAVDDAEQGGIALVIVDKINEAAHVWVLKVERLCG